MKERASPPQPGHVLGTRIQQDIGVRQADFARALGISRCHLNMILKGTRQITPEIALRVAKVIGPSAQYWLGLRTNWELFTASERLRSELDGLARLKPHLPSVNQRVTIDKPAILQHLTLEIGKQR